MYSTGLLLLAITYSQAEPAKNTTEPAPIEQFKAAAAQYEIQLEDAARSRLKLEAQPVLHWDNPARTAEDGAVFIWVKDGRPEVIGSIFTYKLTAVRTKHEFQSLSAVPLSAKFQGQVAWKPREAGVTFRPIPDAPAPSPSERLRTVQLKALAREFDAKLINLQGEITELRLVPQPLYRYPVNGKTLLDGAIFSFALGTDPEALLLIEARQSADAWRWEYAFGRFHFAGLQARHQGHDVWRVEADREQLNTNIGNPAQIAKPYVTFHVE